MRSVGAGSISPDGRLVAYAPDYVPGQRYPLIVQVHGGPASAVINSFSGSRGYFVRIRAAKGYALFQRKLPLSLVTASCRWPVASSTSYQPHPRSGNRGLLPVHHRSRKSTAVVPGLRPVRARTPPLPGRPDTPPRTALSRRPGPTAATRRQQPSGPSARCRRCGGSR